MRIQLIVAANEIVSRGRTISRLKQTTHAGFWRRAASGTWFCTQVEGKRSAEGMTYTLDIVRMVDLAVPRERPASADWGCLDGYSVIEIAGSVGSAASLESSAGPPGTDGGEPPEASADG